MAVGDRKTGDIASEVTTRTTSGTGARRSKDSDWTEFEVPDGWAIVEGETVVHIISARGSEHSYVLQYDDETEVVPGTGIMQPTTIRLKTHARSSRGHFGGSGSMKVKVEFVYVQFR